MAATYTVVASDQCLPGEVPEVTCRGDIDYCVEYAQEEWIGHDGQLSFVVCADEGRSLYRVVSFHGTEHVPERVE